VLSVMGVPHTGMEGYRSLMPWFEPVPRSGRLNKSRMHNCSPWYRPWLASRSLRCGPVGSCRFSASGKAATKTR
jgi:hypothetical protein